MVGCITEWSVYHKHVSLLCVSQVCITTNNCITTEEEKGRTRRALGLRPTSCGTETQPTSIRGGVVITLMVLEPARLRAWVTGMFGWCVCVPAFPTANLSLPSFIQWPSTGLCVLPVHSAVVKAARYHGELVRRHQRHQAKVMRVGVPWKARYRWRIWRETRRSCSGW